MTRAVELREVGALIEAMDAALSEYQTMGAARTDELPTIEDRISEATEAAASACIAFARQELLRRTDDERRQESIREARAAYRGESYVRAELARREEPVAWRLRTGGDGYEYSWHDLKKTPVHPSIDPVNIEYAFATTAPKAPEGWVLVPEPVLRWLNGEEGDFECPPDLMRQSRGAMVVPPYWWRSEFRRRIAAAAPLSAGERVSAQHIENLKTFARNAPRTYRDHDEPDPAI